MKRALRTWYGKKLPSEKLLQRLISEVGNPPFDREKVFDGVDASNRQFEKFTDEQRKELREEANRVRERVSKYPPKKKAELLKQARTAIKKSRKKV